MITIGLTGGIGAGKSTVAQLFVQHGTQLIDADAIAHDVLGPGTDAFASVVERFGSSLVRADGTIDRAELGTIVFADPVARHDLEAIVHPAVGAVIERQLAQARAEDQDVVVDIPLLVETDARHRYGLDVVVVVDAPEPVVLARLVRDRGMDEDAAQARMAAQTDRFNRLAAADAIIENSGTLSELADMVDTIWQWIAHLGPGSAPLDLTPREPPR
ncbi:MAG: dephospho-CoA kinase [Acidimicrobiales bacterium]